MEFNKTIYKTESYYIELESRTLAESDIITYYKEKGYNVYHKYAKRLREGEFMVSNNTIKLFESYANGYPDLLLISITDPEKVRFVEVKLDGDSLRPNQIVFNNELAKLEDVTVEHFHNIAKYTNKNEIVFTSKVNNAEKEMIKRLDALVYIQKKKKYKDLWVVAQLYKEFGNIALRKKFVGIIANKLNINKKTIVWFIKNTLKVNNSKK